jgi:hypothetical protein
MRKGSEAPVAASALSAVNAAAAAAAAYQQALTSTQAAISTTKCVESF